MSETFYQTSMSETQDPPDASGQGDGAREDSKPDDTGESPGPKALDVAHETAPTAPDAGTNTGERSAEVTTSPDISGNTPSPAVDVPRLNATASPAADATSPNVTASPAADAPSPNSTASPATDASPAADAPSPSATASPAADVPSPSATASLAAAPSPSATASPAADAPSPSATASPAADAPSPNVTTSPAADAPSPAADAPSPNVTASPATDAPSPNVTASPATDASPAADASPTAYAPSPSATASPAADAPSPNVTTSPAADAPSPAADAPSPNVTASPATDASPAADAPSPSATASPAADAPSPNATAKAEGADTDGADNGEAASAKAEEEFEDVLGNGTLLKKVVVAGDGPRPQMGERVVIGLIMHIPELAKSFPPTERDFVLFDGDVEQALDLTVALMNLHEKAVVIAGYKYMYGEIGLEPDVPPFANFKLEIHLKQNHGVPNYPSLGFDICLSTAKAKKERGNFMFKRKEYTLALNCYKTSGKILDPDQGSIFPDETPERLQELLDFRAVILCNTSVAQVKLGAFEAAVKAALEATKLKPANGKAYYRLGQAYEKNGQIDDCIKSYKLALKHGVENTKFIHGELARLTKKNKDVKQTQQQMYSKMFWGSKPPPVSKQSKKEEASLFSWLWKAGLGVMGAGVAGLAGIGLYKYMNH